MNTPLSALAAQEAASHRRRLLELFAPTQSLMIGAFTVGLDDILAELSAKYCYMVAAEVSAQARQAASPDASARAFGPAKLQERLAREHAMVRVIPQHHAKYWVGGLGADEQPIGVLFSGDLMPSALSPDEPAGNSHELLLELAPDESVELAAFARWAMHSRPAKDILPTQNQVASGGPAATPKLKRLLLTQPNQSLQKDVLLLIDQAEHSIVATTWLLEEDCRVVQRLISAASTLSVTVIAHDHQTNLPALGRLAEAGARVLLCPGMHAKLLMIDGAQQPSAIVTSANLLKEGYENGIEIGLRLPRGDQRIGILQAFLAARLELCRQLARPEPTPARARSIGALKDLSQVVKVAPKVRIF
jgi:hypothetical protein